MLVDNLIIMIGNNWGFCLTKCTIQSFLCFSIPVQVLLLPGQELIETRSLSHTGLLQKGPTGYVGLLPKGVASPQLVGRCTLGLNFSHGFTFAEPPEKPAILPHLRTHWIRSVFHWYGYLAAIFVPSLGTTEVMLRVDALTTQQALQDSQKAISALNAEQIQIRKAVLQNRLALDILRAAQGGTCALFIPNIVLMLLALLNA